LLRRSLADQDVPDVQEVLVYLGMLDFLSLPFLLSNYWLFPNNLYSLYHMKYTAYLNEKIKPWLSHLPVQKKNRRLFPIYSDSQSARIIYFYQTSLL
jgi:hypothetical protein